MQDLALSAWRSIIDRHPTPAFFYQPAIVEQRSAELRRLFGERVELLYAIKANPHSQLLKRLRSTFDGLDVSSHGELEQALEIGYPAGSLSFTGPAKTVEALKLAVSSGLGAICVESLEELDEVAALADYAGKVVPIRLRINPPEPIVSYAVVVGGRPSPFGIELEEVPDAMRRIAGSSGLRYLGPHFFTGAQCLSADALARHVAQCLEVTRGLEQHGLAAESINLGGGFGVPYLKRKRPLDVGLLAARAKNLLDAHEQALGRAQRYILELGRYLVAPAGIFVSRVRRVKQSRGKSFAILDGGINCFFAASGIWSGGQDHFRIENIDNAAAPKQLYQLSGPLCTPADSLGRDVELPEVRPGDRLSFANAGAYGPSASLSRFIAHPPVTEVVL